MPDWTETAQTGRLLKVNRVVVDDSCFCFLDLSCDCCGCFTVEESKLKMSVSQGDLTEGIGSAPKDTSVKVSPNTKGSAEEAAAISRGGNRSQSLKVSNGSATEETLSSPLFQSANVEDGPVLQPPSKSLKQAPAEKTADTTEVIQEDSGDESVV
ncbi:hypothetical protein EB796_009784 [Bugula neritina]|uniref:Uncharacterized protein n=1 Tax=Bugula neritina TaxID=10212 RepID=A0A7J7JZS1_BUGNE|nr:hypothetical protein EB796_009784 [Bugula neritina]